MVLCAQYFGFLRQTYMTCCCMPVLPIGLDILSLEIVFNIAPHFCHYIGWCHDSDSVFARSSIRSKYSLNIIIHHYPYRYNICWRNDSDSVVSISGTGSNQRGIELAGLLGSFIPKYWPVTLQKSEIGKNRKYIFLKEGKILVIHLS